MPSQEFIVGDSVRSKSGGPFMLVEDIRLFLGWFRYRCMWMDAEGKLRYADFRGDELERPELDSNEPSE